MLSYIRCVSVSIGNRMNASAFIRFTLRIIFENPQKVDECGENDEFGERDKS